MGQISTGSVFQKDTTQAFKPQTLSASTSTPGHIPVLLKETLHHLNVKPGAVFLDGTFGGGGHTRAILDVDPSVKVVALDQDPQAMERARPLQQVYVDQFS
jgi:16S rRNA C1402 N4-methylase RsmH